MLSLILSLLRQVVLLLPAALVLGLLAPRLIWLSFLLAEGFPVCWPWSFTAASTAPSLPDWRNKP